MEFDGKFFKGGEAFLKKKWHLEDHGKVQQTLDQLVITYMGEYTPFQSGVLASSTGNTDIGSGLIRQDAVYARYQYYGELYVDPITKKGAFYSENYGFWSRPRMDKILSGKQLNYDKSRNPKAGSKWFERMKADRKQDILNRVEEVAKGG